MISSLPGLNQYQAEDKVSCLRTQHSESNCVVDLRSQSLNSIPEPTQENKTCLRGFANKGAGQPAHLQSDQPLWLFAYWKVLYQNLPQAKFHFSSRAGWFGYDWSDIQKTSFLMSQPIWASTRENMSAGVGEQ